MTSGEDWEEKLVEQLVEMFRNMGMDMDKEQIRGMMEQFRSQFENMGLDAEKNRKRRCEFQFRSFSLGQNVPVWKTNGRHSLQPRHGRPSRCQPC